MPRNGSGTMTPDIDFTTEAASPPIEISKLDQVLDDIADEITNSIAADGQTNPTADLKMNGFRHTNVGAATALTQYARVTELIDQDHIFYVDSGAANAYVITPSPAIAAYEEGQRFVFRAANASTTASTLNVNGLGAIAIQTPDGSALIANSILAGGFYEVTYDANASPDRWVLTSPSSRLPDGMLSSNIPLKDADNTFSQSDTGGAVQTFKNSNSGAAAYAQVIVENDASRNITFTRTSSGWSGTAVTGGPSGEQSVVLSGGNFPLVLGTNGNARAIVDGSGNFDFKAGTVTTSGASAGEVGTNGTVQNVQNGDYTLVLTDRGKSIDKQSGGSGETITIPANASVAFPIGTVICGDNDGGGSLTIAITSDTLEDTNGNTGSRTIADNGFWSIKKIAATKWRITGAGIS